MSTVRVGVAASVKNRIEIWSLAAQLSKPDADKLKKSFNVDC
jgi:hypothetical protein